MGKRTENRVGKRVKKGGRGPAVALVVCVCVVVVLLGGYLGLCAWAGGHVLPNSAVAGVEIGGLSRGRVAESLEAAVGAYRGQTVNLTYDQISIPCELDRAGLAFDAGAAMEQLSVGEESFLRRGAAWLSALTSGTRHEVEGALVFQNQEYVDGLMDQVTASLSQPVRQHETEIEDTAILLTRGQAGLAVDAQTTETALLERLNDGDLSDFPVEPRITEPNAPDFEALRRQVSVEPMNAALDPETFEITPSRVGVSFDVATAQALFERTEPGESCKIPLELTEPEISTEKLEQSLFADKLGEATSTVGGDGNRLENVRLAGEFCNGTILLPGEEFSYWDTVGPCTTARGFLPAPSYVNGQTVDSIGGGLCQMSSSIYYAAVLSNLEIVERRNHSFAISYLPEGCDAMVSGSSDFRFKNNTQYPIKIVVALKSRDLSVQIWGTKTDDTYVKVETTRLSVTNYTTLYEIDDSVPAGTTKVKVDPYTGRKVEAYRCIYAADGTLISRTLENVSNYQKRDKVVLINSADAAKYGLGGEVTPPAEETPSTEVTPPATETPSTEVTPPATETPSTEVTPPAEETPSPEVTPPAGVEVQPIPEETPSSEVPPPPPAD